MNFSKLLITLLLSVTFGSLTAQDVRSVSYEPDNTLFSNPETGGMLNFFSTGTSEFLPAVSYISSKLSALRDTHGLSTVFLTYYLGDWKYQAIPQWALDRIGEDLATLRGLGLKAIPHFHYAYQYEYNNPQVWEEEELEAPKAIIIQHCEQLQPIWKENVDVLALVDYGMIGPWGEMWISGQGHLGNDEDVPSPHRNANNNTREIVNTWMETVPLQRTVLFNPTVKRQLYGASPLTASEAFSGSDKSRMGFENQCFLTDTDSSDPTYENNAYRGPTSYLAEDGLYVPQIGFTDDNCGYKPTQNQLIGEITKGHWDLISIESLERILSDEEDRLSVIKNTGYRFQLTEASLQKEVKPGDAITVNFTLQNLNGGTLYNPRGFELILRHQTTGELTKLKIEEEKGNRLFFPSSQDTKQYTFTVGASPELPIGDYALLLNFPDPEPALYNDPRFSIRLANKDVWEATTGYNRLLHTLSVKTSTPGTAYTGDQWFGQPAVTSQGTGLTYTLYDNLTLSGSPLSEGVDATVNFDWQNAGPAPGLPADSFSVRWQGQVQAEHPEEYTFYTRSDDGVRLWVDGKLLVDNWTNHAETEDQGSITLQADQKYDIRLEYFENGGKAVCKLLWQSASQVKQVIPPTHLYSPVSEAASAAPAVAPLPAFPGAEGGGAQSVGGRGGKVIEVTNLNDSGPGSLRAALLAKGKRTVVFRVGGIIDLQKRIDVYEPYLTIAGQTAPGGGILIKGNDINIHTHDVVIRYVKYRTGRRSDGGTSHTFFIRDGARDIIIDHCSLSWAEDECFTAYATSKPTGNVTLSWSYVSEGIQGSGGHNNHAAGPIVGSASRADLFTNFSLHHSLMSHHMFRFPYLKISNGEVINTIAYDWLYAACVIEGGVTVDLIGNQYKLGNSYAYGSPYADYDGGIIIKGFDGDNGDKGPSGLASIFIENNLDHQYQQDPKADNWGMFKYIDHDKNDQGALPLSLRRYTRQTFSEYPVTVHPVTEAQTLILEHGGAYQRLDENGAWVVNRDVVDQRLIQQFLTGTGGLMAEPSDVGGWPTVDQGTPYADTDHDGMSDVWEVANGFDKNDASDGNQDADGDGFTNVEEFLNGTVPTTSGPTTTYTVRARGLQGTEEMALQIGGETVQSWTVGKIFKNYSYTGSETSTVRVAITNDQGVNHDLIIDRLTVDSTVYQAEAQVINTGVWQNGCGGTESEWLHCSGYIEFDLGGANARQANQFSKQQPTTITSSVSIYPNPSADGGFTVRGVGYESQVSLYSLHGQRIAITQRLEQEQQTVVQSQVALSPGLYIVRVQSGSGDVSRHPLLIE